MPLLVPTYDETIRAESPTSYWRLGEASGTNAVDQSAANAGTYVGTPTLGATGPLTGDSSTGVTLNGSTQYVSLSNDAVSGDHAIEAWVKLAALGNQLSLFYYAGTDGSNNGWGMGVGDGAGGSGIKFVGLFGGVAWIDSGYTFVDTNWHHVVMSQISAVTNFYVDSVIQSGTRSGLPAAPTGGMTIGAQISTGSTRQRFFSGSMAETAFYKVGALTQAQVTAHYRTGNLGPGH